MLKLREIVGILVWCFLSELVLGIDWIPYTQTKYFSYEVNPTFAIPDEVKNPEITVTTLTPEVIQHAWIFSGGQIIEEDSMLTTNFTKLYSLDPNGQDQNIYVNQLKNDDTVEVEKFLIEIKDQDTGEVVTRKTFEDGYHPQHGLYYLNTTKQCRIKITADHGIGRNNFIALMKPNTPAYPGIYEAYNQTYQSFNTLTAQLQFAGEWIIKIFSAAVPTYQLQYITIETDADYPCQNMCYGPAAARGSSGWDFLGEKCVCDVGTYEHPEYGCVKFLCSSIDLENSPVNPDECLCPPGTTWYPEFTSCGPEIPEDGCENDAGSTGVNLQNGQCQCLFNFFWNQDAQKCHANCNQKLSVGIDQSNPHKCQCRIGAYWNTQRSQCTIDCLSQLFSTGQSQSPEVCQCVKFSDWKPDTLKCQIECSQVPYSTGQKTATGDSCICQNTHQWAPGLFICQRICQPDHYTTGTVLQNGQCQCTADAKWNFYLQKCTNLDCGEIAFATGPSATQTGCICQSDFIWNPLEYLCVIDCPNLPNDPYGEKVNINSYECACPSKMQWILDARRCEWRCELIENTTKSLENGLECECVLGFTWHEDGFCEKNCGLAVGQTGNYDQLGRHCECADGFDWSYEQNACFRLCENYQNALPEQGPTASSCYCFSGFHWDSTDNFCKLDCDGYFDLQISEDQTQCICQPNSIFNTRQKKCLINCNIDLLSTHYFNLDRCECKANAVWNSQINECECIPTYVINSQTENCESQEGTSAAGISLGIAGGAIFSGVGVFVGMRIFYKRKGQGNNRAGYSDTEKNHTEHHHHTQVQTAQTNKQIIQVEQL